MLIIFQNIKQTNMQMQVQNTRTEKSFYSIPNAFICNAYPYQVCKAFELTHNKILIFDNGI